MKHVSVSKGAWRKSGLARVLVVAVVSAVAWAGLSMFAPSRADSATLPGEVMSYTVRPGDTLWSYAESITPRGGDVSQTVDELMDLNNLDSSALTAGQRIIVPAE